MTASEFDKLNDIPFCDRCTKKGSCKDEVCLREMFAKAQKVNQKELSGRWLAFCPNRVFDMRYTNVNR